MFDILWVFLESVWIVFKTVGIILIKLVYDLSSLPTSSYSLVQFICKHNVVILNNEKLTNVLLWIAPLIVSHLTVYLFDKFKIRNIKVKELLSIILYIIILNLFSSWIFWTILGVTIVIVGIIYFYSNNKQYD